MALNNVALIEIVDEFLDSSDESDSESDTDELLLNEVVVIRDKRPRLQHYLDIIALYDDQEFKSNFRLRRDIYGYILNLIQPDLEKWPERLGRYPISASKQLYIALWMLATPDSFRSVCTKFDVGKATAWRCLLRIVKALYKLRNVFISWPTREKAEHTWTKMEQQYQFPGIIGAVDGILVKITAPKVQ